MTDEIFECRDPSGVPFAETNNYVDRRWAMNAIAAKDAFIAELEAENKALRAALKPFADRYGEITKMLGGVTQDYAVLTVDVGFGDLCTAHAALKGERAS